MQISEYRSKAAGITKLIECLCRSDKENWPKSLQLALDNTGYYTASELWDMREGKLQIAFMMLFSYCCNRQYFFFFQENKANLKGYHQKISSIYNKI